MTEFDLGVDAAVRVVVAILLGAAVGVEREIDDQPAGIRTHLTVALGAALFGVVSTLGFDEFKGTTAETNVRIDVTRVASQVVVGIGFLGAGLIFRQGGKIRNLTTAASLWATAAIGLLVGVGNLGHGVLGTAGLLIALGLLRAPRDWVRNRFTKRQREFRVGVVPGHDRAAVASAVLDLPYVDARIVGFERVRGVDHLRVMVEARPGHAPERLIEPLLLRSDVSDVRFADEDVDSTT